MSSSSAAVVRVKRKRTDDPVAALVLSFKRSRPDDRDRDDQKNEVFRFTGTTTSDDENTSLFETRKQLKKIFSDRTMINIMKSPSRRFEKLHLADVRLKCQRKKEELTRRRREDFLLSLRSIDMREEENTDETIVEKSSTTDNDSIETKATVSDITCNDEPLLRIRSNEKSSSTNEKDYVFDYYVSSIFCDLEKETESIESPSVSTPEVRRKRTSTDSSSDEPTPDVTEYFKNLIDVYPYNLCDEAIDRGVNDVENYRMIFLDGDKESDDDDEDSNAESNWKNEYPDDDEEFENRYDFYDQNYDDDSNGEDEGFNRGFNGDQSILNRMKKMGLEEEEDIEIYEDEEIDDD